MCRGFGQKANTSPRQSKRISFKQLTHPFPRDILDIHTFANLVRGKEMNMGFQLKNFVETKDYYIDRKFHQVKINTEIENDTSIQDTPVNTNESFDLFCERKPDANTHWLKSKPGKINLAKIKRLCISIT